MTKSNVVWYSCSLTPSWYQSAARRCAICNSRNTQPKPLWCPQLRTQVPLLCLAPRTRVLLADIENRPCPKPLHTAAADSRKSPLAAKVKLKESQTWFFWLQIRRKKSVKNPRATSIYTVAVACSSHYSCCGVTWISPALLSCCSLALRWIFCPNPAHPGKAARPTKPSWIISSCFCLLIATGQFHTA